MRKEWPLLLLSSILILEVLSGFPVERPIKSSTGVIFSLASFMLASAVLDISGFPAKVGRRISTHGPIPFIILSSMLAALIMNDAALFLVIPIALKISEMRGYQKEGVIAITVSAVNAGSALTPFGNPQNIIIWGVSNIHIHQFSKWMAPFVFSWLGIMTILVLIFVRGRAMELRGPPPRTNVEHLIIGILLLSINVFFVDKNMALLAFFLDMVIITIFVRKAVYSLNLKVLLFLFLLILDLRIISTVANPFITSFRAHPELTSLLCQALGNVATTSLLAGSLNWKLLAPLVNVGGMGLMTASLANMIAIKLSNVKISKFHEYSVIIFILCFSTTILLLRLLGE